MTLAVLLGSWSVSFSAVQTASYDSFVWSSMMSCSEVRSAEPVLPIAGA